MLGIRGIQVSAASTLAAFDGIFWHVVCRQPQSAAAFEVAERWMSFIVALVFAFLFLEGMIEFMRALAEVWQHAVAAFQALNRFLTLVVDYFGELKFVKDAQRPHYASQAEATPRVDVGEVSLVVDYCGELKFVKEAQGPSLCLASRGDTTGGRG